MLIDSRSLPADETIETDVCIVGAGTAGITLAHEFIDQSFRVCLLESGGLKPDKETQSLCQGENVGYPYFPLYTARARYFGGTSNRWSIPAGNDCLGARMRPLDDIDFEERYWLPYSGWPFSKSALDPYYERAQSICKIKPSTYEVADWEDPDKASHLPFTRDRVNTVIFKIGCRDPFINEYPEEIRRSSNISTCLHANVVDIETDETSKMVTRLRVATLQGTRFWVSAKLFVLAAGGIETPRLLLLSNSKQSCGLGNHSDLVGRFFMEHLHWWSGYYIPSNDNLFESMGLYAGTRIVNGVAVIGKLSISHEVLRTAKLANYSVQLLPRVMLKTSLIRYPRPSTPPEGVASAKELFSALRGGHVPEDAPTHIRNAIGGIDEIAIATYRKFKRKIVKAFNKGKARVFELAHMTEQVPNPDSRVSLDDKCDELGLRRVKLDWQLTPMDILSSIRAQEIIDEELRRADLGRLCILMEDGKPPAKINGGWHHMGTTRMHHDHKKGVVDENCRVHGISNLFIAGPSVFPTGGYANPVLTVVALTARLGDYLKELMK
jgi:choline dehydrogenase-like flavoprotein